MAEKRPRMIARVVHKTRLHETGTDAAYWRSRPPQERLRTLEALRREYHGWPAEASRDDDSPRLQRVCRVLKRS